MESSRLRKDSRRGPNQRSNAPIHHVTQDDCIEIRLVRRVHTPPGPKIEPRETKDRRYGWWPILLATGARRESAFYPCDLTRRSSAYLPARHTRVDTRGRSRSRRKRTRAKTSPGRCNEPRAVESLSDASQFYSVRREF